MLGGHGRGILAIWGGWRVVEALAGSRVLLPHPMYCRKRVLVALLTLSGRDKSQ